MKTILILYIPVIHSGYLDIIAKYQWVQTYILGKDFVEELAEHVELRALDPKTTQEILAPFVRGLSVKVLNRQELAHIVNTGGRIRVITANEAITKRFVERYLPGVEVTLENTFLRWEESNVLSSHDVPHDRVSISEEDRRHMNDAEIESQSSSDWWRRVGSILVKPTGGDT
ncbi:MAG: hypothetical protein A2735_00005 [Candidatus Yanofskybacteria bacterium RIFCSPHIGHO2_01_FULL_41_21]|uniref:Uncharacterized protein n=1 Tax=Candidatus Yanofskybacteria bacterium RIFCSPHIGHO2_01_FULL_41_21 TaxID=1802660 RepID=A0A1F8EBB3_9BACT|nr:MAG: hypothetical protein A2735_00005 [Candidatus Yanofskybacteria bacterium RIFCSPHIGHO2_01_FULL_41_21]